MKHSLNLRKGFASTSVCASLLLTILTPLAPTAAQNNGNVGQRIPILQASEAANYWTPQKMREAKPLDIIRTDSPKPVSQVPLSSSPPVSAPGSGPSSTGLQTLSEPLSIAQLAAPTLLNYSYPFPFTRYRVRLSNYTQYPESTVGKVFFVQNGSSFVCSASAISSTNRRLIWTAGHCLSDGEGTFSTNVVFVPAYRPGTTPAEPFGRWSACGLYTTTAWHINGDIAQDLGAIQSCDRSGTRLHNVTGSLGFLANASRKQHWHPFGYPAGAPFDGRRMIACAASFAVNDSGSPNPIGIGCDMTGGSSGGPWIVRYSPDTAGTVNQINGLNSYGYNNQPDAMYSPYFGNEFLSLRNFAIQDGS